MATLDDILTAQKNGVIAINNLNQTWLLYSRRQSAQYTTKVISAATLIYTGQGYVVSASVLDAGTTVGTIYNYASTTSVAADPLADNKLMVVKNTQDVYPAGFQFTKGLVVVPGTGQTIVVTYSVD